MAKTVKCKVCGEQIARNARKCPHCGHRRRTGARVLGIVLLVFAAVMIIAVLSDAGKPHKVEQPDTGPAAADASAPAEPTEQSVFGVGETVELNDVAVTLADVRESTGDGFMTPQEGQVFLVCEFEIENGSDREIAVSSMLSFQAYVDEYAVNLDISAMALEGKTQLDGSIAAGKKMRGVVGYAAAADWSELELRFTPDFWTGREIVFQYTKAA